MKPQKPKTKNKNGNRRKYKEMMKVLHQSLGETRAGKSRHCQVISCTSNGAASKSGTGFGCVKTHFPKDPNCDICQKTKITRASCRRRAGTIVPRAEHFGDLMTADHKGSQ